MNDPTACLPILNYHGIESREGEYGWQEDEKPYVVSLRSFEKHLDYLSQNGFTALSLDEMKSWLEGEDVCEKPVVLTFDDGHFSHFEHVAPILKRKGFKAIFFVSAGLVGQGQQMDWFEVNQLVRDGFEIGSHGLRHIPLTNLRHHELWKELERSKQELERRLHREIISFSVPRGYYQLRIREVAMELGYRFMFTSRFDVNLQGQDSWRLNRLVVKKKTSFETFSRMICGDLGYVRILERCKETARRFLNPAVYDRLANAKRVLTHD